MELSGLINSSIVVFVLAFARLLGLFIVAPVFSFSLILMRFRILAAFTMALCITPWLGKIEPSKEVNLLQMIILLIKEFSIGALMGMFLSIIFASLRLSAQFFSIQIGMGIAEIFDAVSNESSSLWGYFFYIVGALIFIELGGIHILLKAITESYELLPTFDFLDKGGYLLGKSVEYFTGMFLIALKIAFPIIATALILSITLGIIGKMAPQANIFILGLPLQTGLGMLFILITIPFMVVLLSSLINNSISDVMKILMGEQGKYTALLFK